MAKKNNPLHLAVIDNQIGMITSLLKRGIDPKRINQYDLTPLDLAYYLNRKECAYLIFPQELLLAKDKTIKLKKKGEETVKDYTVKEFEEFFSIEYLPHLNFNTYKNLTYVFSATPWMIKKSLLGRNNRWFGAYYTNEIEKGQIADVSIQWVNSTMQYGLFAEKDFEKQTFIGEYTGLVKQRYRLSPNTNDYCMHYPTDFWRLKAIMIDAKKQGNETRFINHNEEGNLTPISAVFKGFLHTLFVANQPIKKGEQLTFNYSSTIKIKNEDESKALEQSTNQLLVDS